MDAQTERLERLRARRESLTAGADKRERDRLDEEIAEADGNSLTGSGAPRTDTLEGESAHRYVAAMMRQGPNGVNARRILADARAGTRSALVRLRLACLRVRSSVAHAGVSGPRRPGRVRTGRRARRGPARAAPARPRPAGAA